ncbi:TetR/AcrR family transcriptional regulator [Paenibacillus sp. SYP-B3998]|uniref:TetR/AcrR family transcriptional regulator n=1 Tax=Paenibacillus sp. SYP-B3998 TaxID=2678564 RepID=A0A6G3ZZG2_9BACL|nr:TetR/AcrR family transcriptional regulator [Paenibacillus sp. SYP-B3998]NEW07495.1 TetR/AcrR family transcriptional regulator [Paenibacillus sp. SYP-B3998]
MPKTLDENKEMMIIQSARELFGKFGYKKTTIDDIAQAASIAKGTVYIYFQNKKQLLVRIGMQSLLQSQDKLEQELADSDDEAWKFKQIIARRAEDLYAFAEQFPDALEIIPFLEHEELVREGGDKYFGKVISMLHNTLTAGVEKNIFQVDDVSSFIDNTCFMSRAFEPPYKKVGSQEQLQHHIHLYTDTLLNSIRKIK